MDDAFLRALPKVELHLHLDGAIRTATILDLARAIGHPLPGATVAELEPHVRVPAGCRSLRDFLGAFETFYPVLRQKGAVRRIARELSEDKAAEGTVYFEARFAPVLLTAPGLGMEDLVVEVLEGLEEGAAHGGARGRVLLCCYRPNEPASSLETVRLAAKHRDRGVAGVDLAGPEDLPAAPHRAAFAKARDEGLAVTVHAGEAGGPENVLEALDDLGAARLGHGVALRRDPALRERVRAAGVTVEMCPTSNLHTCAVASIRTHPFPALLREGLRVTVSTDDPAVSGIDLVHEYRLLVKEFGLLRDEVRRVALHAAEGAFVAEAERSALRRRIEGFFHGRP